MHEPSLQSRKELLRKECAEEVGEGVIDDRIEWYEDWNYPPHPSG